MSNALEVVKAIGDFARAVGEAPDLSDLCRRTLQGISRQLGLSEGALWLRDPEHLHYRQVGSVVGSARPSPPETVNADHPVPRLLADCRQPLRAVHDAPPPTLDALEQLRAALCLPVFSGTELLGFCTFGPSETALPWDEETTIVVETMWQVASNGLTHHAKQDELRRSSALMRRTDRLRSLEIMAGGFAHEIRNPLTSIKTFVQLAPQRQHDPVFIPEFSRVAIEDVHEIERLLHEILDYARYMAPRPSDEDLNELVASCLCFVSAKASSRGIQLQTDLAPRLPLLSMDRQQMKQVLMNLLLNAIDATPDSGGDICVHTRLLAPTDGAQWVELRVEDHGHGIAADHLEHIFDPFFTTKHSNSESDGSGLGLTIAHQIVREHHGQLLVDSRVGAGSTFTVKLPAPGEQAIVSAPRE